MARSKRRDLWDQTSALRSDIRNMFRSEGVAAVHPDELNPLRVYEPPTRNDESDVGSFISAFVGL